MSIVQLLRKNLFQIFIGFDNNSTHSPQSNYYRRTWQIYIDLLLVLGNNSTHYAQSNYYKRHLGKEPGRFISSSLVTIVHTQHTFAFMYSPCHATMEL